MRPKVTKADIRRAREWLLTDASEPPTDRALAAQARIEADWRAARRVVRDIQRDVRALHRLLGEDLAAKADEESVYLLAEAKDETESRGERRSTPERNDYFVGVPSLGIEVCSRRSPLRAAEMARRAYLRRLARLEAFCRRRRAL